MSTELAWWKDEETHVKTLLEQKAQHEKLLMYSKPLVTSFVVAPQTAPELAREKALAYVREARAVVGAKRIEKLPRGHVRQAEKCVLARALPYCVTVGGSTVEFKNAAVAAKVAQAWATTACGSEVTTPKALRDFVIHFDAGQYKDLIA